jgi:hypothetical protein
MVGVGVYNPDGVGVLQGCVPNGMGVFLSEMISFADKRPLLKVSLLM